MDGYERKARLLPVALVAAPGTILSVTLFGSPDWWQGLVAGAGMTALHYFLAQIVRDKGGKVQASMWREAGGSPTVRMLHWKPNSETSTLGLRRRALEDATGVSLPTASVVTSDDAAVYDLAVGRLRDLTRGSAFALIREENANYGFRRNLYGCRGWGMGVAATGFISSLALFVASLLHLVGVAPTGAILSAVLSAMWWVVWKKSVTVHFVEVASQRYAEALLSAAAFLPRWSARGEGEAAGCSEPS